MSQNSEVEQRKAEVAETRQKEGSGTVPNVTEDETEEDAGEGKEAPELVNDIETPRTR